MSEPEPITVKPMAKVFAAYADLERQLAEAQGKLEAVEKMNTDLECQVQDLNRILRSKEGE